MASLSIRDITGTLIGSTDEIFSGAVGIGSGTVSGTIRVYNNYGAVASGAHARKVRVFLSAQSGSQAITSQFADPYRNIRTLGLINQTMSGICMLASENGGNNPSGTMLSMFSGISGTGYDIIYASGSNNFNQYDIYFTIPSGTVLDTASGSIYIGVEYENYLPSAEITIP